MKYELPFPPLDLSDGDKHALVELADRFLNDTLTEYEAVLYQDRGVVNEAKWKLIKRREDIHVYQVRNPDKKKDKKPRKKSEFFSSPSTTSVDSPSDDRATLDETVDVDDIDSIGAIPSPKMQTLLWYGTIDGELNNLMYGVVSPTTEIMQIKCSYLPNNILDCKVLAHIVKPTPADPFRGVQLKWFVNSGPAIVRQLVRKRDFVYLESTGITHSTRGERIGYHIVHTIEIPGVRHLDEYKFVRANMSVYHLFRQKDDGVIEIYVHGIVDLAGGMPQTVGLFATNATVVALSQATDFAEMKKFTWMLKTQRKKRTGSNDLLGDNSKCVVCHNVVRGSVLDQKTSCRICMGRVCTSCGIAKKLSFVVPNTSDLTQQTIVFCTMCVYAAIHTDALTAAGDELRRGNPNEIYELTVDNERSGVSIESIQSLSERSRPPIT